MRLDAFRKLFETRFWKVDLGQPSAKTTKHSNNYYLQDIQTNSLRKVTRFAF
jgi:hypothetical protein